MTNFSNWEGSEPEGEIAISSPTLHPRAETTEISEAPAEAEAKSLLNVV